MILLIGSKNTNKIIEIRAILKDFDIEIKSLHDFPEIDDVEETGTTFEANAMLKAEAWAKASGFVTIADDSGLCVDALDGAPGVYSARYAGLDKDYNSNNEKLLKILENIPDEQRNAHFVTVIACATPEKTLFTVTGKVEGRITRKLRGDNGFGYDPLFFYPPENATFAEMPSHKKNKLSHRFNALEAFSTKFTEFF